MLISNLFVSLVLLATGEPAPGLQPTSTVLEKGLAAVSPEKIQADVEFVASDDMGGRDTPSAGLRMTGRFIQNRLERLGVAPGYKDGYLHPYPLVHRVVHREGTRAMMIRGSEKGVFEYGKDYFFLSRRTQTQRVAGEVILAGTGDLEGLEVKHRWLLVQDGERSWFELARAADKAGAAGVILTPADDADDAETQRWMKDTVFRQTQGSVGWPRSGEGRRESGDSSPAIVRLTRAAAERLRSFGKQGGQRGDLLGVTFVEERTCGGDDNLIEVSNVCGFWRGSDPVLSREVVIVSAHYDHVGKTGSGEVYNGADDNGSGTVGLLALAEALVEMGPLRRSVLLIWVSGEEKGLLGSRAWTENPWLPDGCRPIANINLDMIGRNEPEKLWVTPTKDGRYKDEYNGLVRLAESLCTEEGFPSLGNADKYYRRSDHANFAKLEIPVTFLFSDVHEDYHKTTDTPDKIDNQKIARVIRLVLRMLDRLQEPELEL